MLSVAVAEDDKEKAAKEEAFDVEVAITGNDQMQFDKKAFTVDAGKKVKLTFKNMIKTLKMNAVSSRELAANI
ncbi:MAG: hypothetical protein GWQ05_02630 [Verrucomicrobiaceae bacterium]|jgi:azurin|nr:hypothetical protein [Verrucomicrobiaceae bacterium]